MKFRVRPGFIMFKTQGEAGAYCSGGISAAHVRPRARAGDVVELTGAEASNLFLSKALGMLEPIDDAARAMYGKTTPLTPGAA